MKTITINKAGKRKTAYISKDNNLVRGGVEKIKISLKEAKELTKGKKLFCEGVLFETYKLD